MAHHAKIRIRNDVHILHKAPRVGLVKKWLFLPIFEQTGAYTSPFGQCDMALSCPDQVHYLLGKIWDSTGADRSTFPMGQSAGLVKNGHFCLFFSKLELTPPLLASVT